MRFVLHAVRFAYTSKAYGKREVFSDLTLTVPSGQCVAVMGEEGSGKSTLLYLLDGLLRPEEGTVCIDGENIWNSPKRLHAIRRRIGVAFQFPETQFLCETVFDELAFASRNFGTIVPSAQQMCAMLDELGCADFDLMRSPYSLSMGEARRVALASAMLHQPDALLFDEPTAGLDAFGVACVLSVLRRLRHEGRTLVIVSHDAEVVSSVAHRAIHLANGKIAHELSHA